nr:LysR family transcriptional regulator [Qipengyuania aerophila]
MPDLEAWAAFAKVVERGSFAQAAEDLGVSKTTVSKMITRLEERMRASLLHRTTRKLSLTETGRLSLERAQRILADGAAIEADILEEAAVPRGTVRMACATGLGVQALSPVLPEFLHLYPDVIVDLNLSEDEIDIVSEGYDLVIRIGESPDSTMRASRLFSFRRPLVGAPHLIERIGVPDHPADLAKYPTIVATNVSWGRTWEFTSQDGESVSTTVNGVYRVNHAAAVVDASVAGIGLALVPEFFMWQQLRDGQLTELLTGWSAPLVSVYMMTPPGRARPARVRVLMEFLRDHFAGQAWAVGIEC